MPAPKVQRVRVHAAFAVFAGLVVYSCVWALGETPLDDSLFFKRFALNFLQQGVFAWNLQDGPVYGSTSQLFQLVSTLLTALFRDTFITAVKLFNALCLLVLGGLMGCVGAASSVRPVTSAALAVLGLSTPVVLSTIGTGMETALALVLVGAALAWQVWQFEAGSAATPRAQILAAMWTALVYTCRPDAALIVAGVFFGTHLMRRTLPWRFVAALAAVMLLLWTLFHLYYGTALPLPFYMKTFEQVVYDANVHAAGRLVKLWYVSCFLCFAAPLLWIAPWRRDPLTVALLSTALAFFGYHALLTAEFMGYRARFYAPALVPLGLAAARSWDNFVAHSRWWQSALFLCTWVLFMALAYRARWLPTHQGFFLDQIHWPAYAGSAAAAALLLLGKLRRAEFSQVLLVAALSALGIVGWWRPKTIRVLSDEHMLRKASAEVTTTRGIFDVARCLPAAKTVYHSEMGVTGLVLIHMRAVDMVGLLSKDTVLGKKNFEQYCSEDRPEVIFLPHKNYQRLNKDVRAAPCFQDYRQMVNKSSSPLFVRQDLAEQFLACAKDIQRWR
jgi:hypothetical protein